MSILDEPIPFNVFSICAIRAARRYIELMEVQLSQAHADERSVAIAEYESLPNRDDQVDYDVYVRTVDRMFEEDFRPMLRLSSVVHLYMLFETYLSRHIAELQKRLKADVRLLKRIADCQSHGLVEAAKTYFRDHAKLSFGRPDVWQELQDLAHLRNCIVHDGGIPLNHSHRASIDRLESRQRNGQPIGIEILRFQGRPLAEPIIIQQQFFEYFLDVLEHFFTSLGTAVDARFLAK